MTRDLDDLVTLFDRGADAMCDALLAAHWTEDDDGRWRSPDRKLSLPLSAAWERARRDAVAAWRPT